MENRPLGVTIIAVLAAIGGVLSILAGIALVGLGAMGGALGGAGGGFLFLGGAIFGVVLLAIGALDLVAAYGAWNLKKWAWTLLVALSVIGIVLALQPLNIIGIAINGVIIYYLFTTKEAFSK